MGRVYDNKLQHALELLRQIRDEKDGRAGWGLFTNDIDEVIMILEPRLYEYSNDQS